MGQNWVVVGGQFSVVISNYRFYDSETGRYLRGDPIGMRGGINLFSYSDNNPVKKIDPLGLKCGSGLSDLIVSDKPCGFNFQSACEQHDKCYGQQLMKADMSHKSKCDKDFLEDMKDLCRKSHQNSPDCIKWAKRYKWGVSNNSLAERAYLNSQVKAGTPGARELRDEYFERQISNDPFGSDDGYKVPPLFTIYF